MSNIIAIVGRPNVGKSTLFNRLVGQRKAIVDSVAGVTRDRHYGKGDWNGFEYSVIDTGGYVHGSEDIFEAEIRKQVKLGVDEARLILFVVDAEEGITPLDEEIAELLRRSGKKVLLTANKTDNTKRINESAEFYALGLGEVYPIAAVSGTGTGELMDEVVKYLEKDVPDPEAGLPRFAIVGRPNVGKSSLLNALIGQERTIVTPIAGTTRDSINTRYNFYGHDFMLVDTAGIRRKAKVKEDLEFYSVMRSIRAIEDADVCLLLIDASQGLEAQDLAIFHLIEENRKGVVIVVNKWDLVEKDTNTPKKVEEEIRKKLAPFKDVPVVFTSALTRQRILKALEMAGHVYQNKTRRISTRELNDVMLPIIENTSPPGIKGKEIRIKFVTQLPGKNPNFAFYANLPQYVPESYRRFLENQLREKFDYCGVPIEVVMKKK
ncbi:MAG: ribosome biogenesis GTPase Der [Bacteroidia bacterium]|nr:ribosome biogenesis GTPase Der [Bacteroidia bacterium]